MRSPRLQLLERNCWRGMVTKKTKRQRRQRTLRGHIFCFGERNCREMIMLTEIGEYPVRPGSV